MHRPYPRLVLAGLRGGSGKTTLSLGLIAAWRHSGREVVPFKKGPDYIDAGWLAFAAGHPCYNLDPFLTGREQTLTSFLHRASSSLPAVIEGNRGLYDGMDEAGSYSTAELAKLLRAPVVLIVDCTKVTRTVAAFVMGAQRFDPEVNIAAVVLNRIAGSRHETMVRRTVEHYCGVQVLGALPKLKARLSERHLGLVPSHEVPEAREVIEGWREAAERNLDLEALWKLAHQAPELEGLETPGPRPAAVHPRPRIGVIRDAAFWFYYPENIEALELAGAEVVELDALKDPGFPELDGLYIGGGFPETFARELAANEGFRTGLRCAIESGLPVYAECGGLMYLSESLIVGGGFSHPMVGILPVSFTLEKKPQGHGYVIGRVEGENPFYKPGTVLHGHEFRYSKASGWTPGSLPLAMRVERGHGFDGDRDGLVFKNLWASYTHIHALGTPDWAPSLVARATQFRTAWDRGAA